MAVATITFDESNASKILDAMRSHLDDSSVVSRACIALSALVPVEEKEDNVVLARRADIGKWGGVEIVLSALTKYQADPGMAAVVLHTLAAVCRAVESNQVLVSKAGGIELVVQVMRAHPTTAEVQRYGCWALAIIAYNADNQVLVAKAGGIEAVIAAMRAHPTTADVQHYGCWALMTIAVNADNKVLVAKAGGIEAVVAAMRAHPTTADVQHRGCWALLHIGWSSPDIRKRMVAMGGADVARDALKSYPTHAGVQEKGKALLAKLGS